jgi:hypothetical protein
VLVVRQVPLLQVKLARAAAVQPPHPVAIAILVALQLPAYLLY